METSAPSPRTRFSASSPRSARASPHPPSRAPPAIGMPASTPRSPTSTTPPGSPQPSRGRRRCSSSRCPSSDRSVVTPTATPRAPRQSTRRRVLRRVRAARHRGQRPRRYRRVDVRDSTLSRHRTVAGGSVRGGALPGRGAAAPRPIQRRRAAVRTLQRPRGRRSVRRHRDAPGSIRRSHGRRAAFRACAAHVRHPPDDVRRAAIGQFWVVQGGAIAPFRALPSPALAAASPAPVPAREEDTGTPVAEDVTTS